MTSIARRCLLGIAVAGAVALGGAPASAVPAPEPVEQEGSSSLIAVPPGCSSPEPADVAFVGTAVAKDFEKVRYEIVQLRAGSATGSAIDGLLDVLYFEDVKFIDIGDDYLVGARFDPEFGQMFSTVKPPQPLFGGNDVIGLNDSDIDCPDLDDPVRTLYADGSGVDSGVLTPLFDNKRTLLATLGVPTAIAFAVLIALILLRYVLVIAFRGIFELGRAAVTPTPDHRAVRTRGHRADEAS
ncbi:MAG: hypothetical protein HKN44_11565 [Ilumatobacter sp.]|nr:hypothetical protein [Ilumatobacter sp.]